MKHNLLLFFLLCLVKVASAQSVFISNDNTPGTSFSDPTKWTCQSGACLPSSAPTFAADESFIIRDGDSYTIDADLTIDNLTIGQGTSGILRIGNDATSRNFTITGALTTALGGSLQVNATAAVHIIEVQSNITNNGSLDLFNSILDQATLNWNGVGANVTYSGNDPQLGNIVFKDDGVGNRQYFVGANFDIQGNVIIEDDATFVGAGNSHTVNGNWTELVGGAYNGSGGGTVTFTNSLVQSLSSDNVANNLVFENLVFNGGGIVAMGADVYANGNFSVTNNTTINSGRDLFFRADLTVDVGSSLTQTARVAYFDGTIAQNISLNGTEVFNAAYFDNGILLANAKSISGDLFVQGLFYVYNDAFVTSADNLECSGFRVDNVDPASTQGITGNVTIDGGTVYARGSNTTIDLSAADIDITADVTLENGDTFLTDNFSLTGAGVDFYIFELSTLTGNVTSSFTLNDDTRLRVRGTNNFPGGFVSANYSIHPNSQIRYDGTVDQNIVADDANWDYGILLLSENSTKTALGNITVLGTLFLRNDVTFDMDQYDVTVGGDVDNVDGGSITIDTSNFGTFTLNGTDNTQVFEATGGGTYTLGNFNINKQGLTTDRNIFFDDSFTFYGSINWQNPDGDASKYLIIDMNTFAYTFSGAVGVETITIGSYLEVRTAIPNIPLINNIDDLASVDLDFDGTILEFYRNGAQQIPSQLTIRNLELSGSGTKIPFGNLDVNGDFSRTAGTPVFAIVAGQEHTVGGNWNMGQAYTNSQGTVRFDGTDQLISASNFNNVIYDGTGTKTVVGNHNITGDLTIIDGVAVSVNDQAITIGGNWDVQGATSSFLHNSGTTTFNSTGQDQTIRMNSSSSFANLTINKTNASFETVQLLTDVTVGRTLDLDQNDAVLDLNGFTMFIGDNFQYRTGTSVISGGGLLHFNGNAEQSINNFNTAALPSLTFTGAGEKRIIQTNLDVDGDITIIGSTLDALNRQINISGNWSNSGTFQSTNRVTFDGADQTISASEFHDVYIAGSGTTTLNGNITLSGLLEIVTGSTLDVSSSNYNIVVEERWTNDGTFVAQMGKVTMNGGSADLDPDPGMSGGENPNKSFYDLEINVGATSRIELESVLDVDNDFTITAGRFETDENDVFVGGNFVNNGVYTHNVDASLLTLNASSGTKTFIPGSSGYRSITIDASGALYQLQSDLDMTIDRDHNLTINGGTLDLEGNTIETGRGSNVNGVVVGVAGTLDIDAGASLIMGRDGLVTNAGVFRVVGVPGNPATINASDPDVGDYYAFVQTSGIFHARNFIIQNTKGEGIDLQGGTIDQTNNLTDGIFSGGTGNQYLKTNSITISPDINPTGTIFNEGTTSNVQRTAGATGIITFSDYAGTLGGPSFEDDAGNLIDWDNSAITAFRWDGGGDGTSWNDGNNWTGTPDNTIPSASDNVILDNSIVTTPYTVDLNTTTGLAQTLEINENAGVTLQVNGINLDIANDFIMIAGTLTHTGAASEIQVGGGWIFSSNGTFNNGTSTVVLDAAAGTTNLIAIAGNNGNFNNLEIAGGDVNTRYAISSDIDIDGNFVQTEGLFDILTANTISVAGDWTKTGGIFNAGLSTVDFNGSGTQNISGGNFWILRFSGGGTKDLQSNISVDDDLVITGGGTVVQANSQILFVRDNWTNNVGLTGFVPGTGSVILDGGGQTIGGSGDTNFNTLFISGNGNKTISSNLNIAGDMFISFANIAILQSAITVTGTGTGSLNMTNGELRVEGNNFPSGFGTYNLTAGLVNYRADADQTVYPTTYFDLRLDDANGPGPYTKTLTGDIIVNDDFVIGDGDADPLIIDFAGYTASVFDVFAVPASATLNWNSGTFIHFGGNFNIDADIAEFNNLILRGSGDKNMLANLNITGDVTLETGITLDMVTYTMTRTPAGGILDIQGTAALETAIPAITGVAFPTGFTTYNVSNISTVTLDGAADQDIFTGATYGNLNIYTNGNASLTGVLDVDGNFNMNNNPVLVDAGFDIFLGGADNDIRNHNQSVGATMTFDGTNQNVRNDTDAGADILDFSNLVFAGSGTKTLNGGQDTWNITEDITINAGVSVVLSRSMFVGGNFSNAGDFSHINNNLTFTGVSPVAGPYNLDFGATNNLRNLQFTNAETYNIINNGMDVNAGYFVVDATTTLDFGPLTHHLACNTNTLSGTVLATSTSFVLDRFGQQILPDITMEFLDLTLSGSGNKIFEGDFTIDDILIESGTRLFMSADGGTTLGALNVRGNWENQGIITMYTAAIEFESNDGTTKTINSGGYSFYDLLFNQDETNSRTYQIVNSDLDVINSLTIGANATLDLNARILGLGNNDAGTPAGEQHYVQTNGTLDIGPNGIIEFDGNDLDQRLQVDGTLRMVGTNGNLASIERRAGGNRLEIEIMAGGSVEAQYYQVQFISDQGLIVNNGATVDPVNNFSNGVWTGIRTTNTGNYRYLQFDAAVAGTMDIANLTFNHGGTPVAGVHFNIGRDGAATGTINIIGQATGLLSGKVYEADPTGNVDPGLITWTAITPITWIGGVSSEWENGANWSGGLKPTLSDDITIPLGQPNNPIIGTADAIARDVTITNGLLSILNGYNLTIASDIIIGTGTSTAVLAVDQSTTQITIGGSFSMNNNSVYTDNNSLLLFNAASGSVTIAPNAISSFSNVTFNGAASFLVSGALIDINGDFILSGGGVLSPITNNHQIFVAGDMTVLGGSISPVSTGFVILDGDNQDITDCNFQGLRVEGTGTKTMYGTTFIVDELQITSTLSAAVAADINMLGNTTINLGGTFNDGNETHVFSGNTWTGVGSYVGSGIIQFNRAANQNINGGNFHTIEFSSNGNDKILLDNVTVTGDILLEASVAEFRATEFLLSGDGTGTFTAEANVDIYISGADNFPDNFSTYALDETTQTRYDGNSAQIIRGGLSYGDLILTNPNNKTLESSISVQRDLIINDATLVANSFNINVGDDFDNDASGSFIAGTGTVRLNGTNPGANQDIRLSATGTKSFYNLIVDNDLGFVRQLFGDLTVTNDFRLDDGNYRIDDNDDFLIVGNNITIQNGEIFQTRGNVRMNKASGTAFIVSGGATFLNFIIDGNATFQLGDDFAMNGNFTQNSGTFTLNGNTARFGNNLDVVSIGSVFNVSAGGRMELGNDVSVNVLAGGTFNAIGTSGNDAVITRSGTSRYNFNIDGTVGAQYYLFEYMSGNGIFVNSTATISTTNNFSNGTFANGAAGGTYLRIENTQNLNAGDRIENTTFADNPGGGATNVTKIIASAGNIEFFDASGDLSGESFDNDPNDLITWTGAEILTWNGLINDDWFTAGNWDSNLGGNKVPDGTQDLIIPTGVPQFPVINNAVSTGLGKSLNVNSGAFLQIVSNDGITDLDLSGDLNLNGIFTNSGSNVAIEVAGNWSKSGGAALFSPGASLVTLNSTTGIKNLNNGSSLFYDLTIDGNSGYILGASTTIINDLLINSNLDMGANTNDLRVGGNFTNSGVFQAQNADLILDASDGLTKTFTAGGSVYYNIDLQPTVANTYQLAGNLIANNNVSIMSTTLDLNGNNLTVGSSSNTLDIRTGGILEVNAGEQVFIGANSNIQVSSNGYLRLIGTNDANVASVSRRASGRYGIQVLSGGHIEANFYKIEYLNGSGLAINNGAIIDPTSPGVGLTNGEFSNGASTSDSRYLTVLNNLGGGFTLSTIEFLTGPEFNVVRQTGTGVLTIEDGTGSLGGPAFEKDDEYPGMQSAVSGLIQWNFTVPVLTWNGTVNNNWDEINNWSPAGLPGSTTIVYIPAGVTFEPIISVTSALAGEINFQAGGNLTLSNNLNLDVSDNIDFNGEIFAVSAGSASTITVGGTILNVPTSTVDFGNNSTLALASNSVTPVTFSSDPSQPFNNLSIIGTATYEPDASVDVNGNLNLVNGSIGLKLATDQLNLGGDLVVGTGTQLNTMGGDFYLDGTNQAITIDGLFSISDLYVQGSGNKSFNDGFDVRNLVVIPGVTITAVGSIDIDVTGDWENEGIFVPGSSTVRYIGTTLQTIENEGGGFGNYNNIVFNNTAPGAAQFELLDPITIKGDASFIDGIVLEDDPSNEIVTFDIGSSIITGPSDASYIDGRVSKIGASAFTFPIGKNGIFARIGISSLSGSDTFTAEYFNIAAPNNKVTDGSMQYASGFEHWNLTRTGSETAFVTLYWEDKNRSEITDLDDLTVAYYNASSQWESKGNGGATGIPAPAGSITSTQAFTNFGLVSFGSLLGVNPLPIELLYFKATPVEDIVLLEWATGSEINNDFFTVERSKTGDDFEAIIEVSSQEPTGGTLTYYASDEQPYSGISYYRLKQTDLNGDFSYEGYVIVNREDSPVPLAASVFPNPFVNSFTLDFSGGNEAENLEVLLTDEFGKQIQRSTSVTDDQGYALIEYAELANLPTGIYILTIISEKGPVLSKVIKQ